MGTRISEAGLDDNPEHLWNVLTRLCMYVVDQDLGSPLQQLSYHSLLKKELL